MSIYFIKIWLIRKLPRELPFYKSFLGKASISKYLKSSKNCAQSYRAKVLDSRDLAVQPKMTNTHVNNKIIYLLDEMKTFKFQLTLQEFFCKEIEK